MTTSSHSPIKTEARRIDGVSIRYAESDARDVSAILLSPWQESLFTFEQMWSRLAEHAHLVAIDLPVQIITGDHDPGVLPVNSDYLHKQLPHSKSVKINAGHFAWADAADEYTTQIIDWWSGGYERV
ncbi:MAG: hypothetical protein DMG13_29250 [Acidobacteria bacterium]|nr:MAG: hypothetical protein DMG13_29250 [Acidobacteriota bacterium]